MRYTTSSYGETVRVVGRFTSGRAVGQVTLILINLENNFIQALSSATCTEIAGTSSGGRSLYVWPTSNITTQPLVKTEFVYVMSDAVTGQIQEGKIVLGGYPDESAISRYQDKVQIDTLGNGMPLTTPGVFEFPIGTRGMPVDNVTDARTIADFLGIMHYHINGSITISSGVYTDWTFMGEEPRQDTITLASAVTIGGSNFDRIGIEGDLNGTISASECLIGDSNPVTGVDGVFTDCGFSGIIKVKNGGLIRGLRINWLDTGGTTLDFDGAAAGTQLIALCAGNFRVINAPSTVTLGISMQGGGVTFQDSVQGALIILYGYGERINGGLATFSPFSVDYMIRGSRIDVATGTRTTATELATAHGAGSWEGGASWDEPLTSHITTGTFGWFMQKLLTVAKFLGLK